MSDSTVCGDIHNKPVLVNEITEIYRKLEQEYDLLRFYVAVKPERRIFCVKLDTRQILCFKSVKGSRCLEDGIDLREVKEVRMGKNSKAFEKWPDETTKYRCNNESFNVFYGNCFILKTLSCVAKKEECELWATGIHFLTAESIEASYPLLVKRYLHKKFYNMKNLRGVITLRELKAFLPQINLKLPSNRLKEYFQEACIKHVGEIDCEDFASLYCNLIYDESLFSRTFGQYTKDGQRVTLEEFKSFLLEQQQDTFAEEDQKVSKFMRDYLQDPSRDAQEPFFTVFEFLDFLFSKQNDIWDSTHDEVNQDMSQPLVNYWIASSHNTYLTGNQFMSESSVEAYARCLRMGCRCIELDCWDSSEPDGMPYVYHGRTLTSKIKFIDVIRTIKHHAFVTSEYPIILSIENHCTLPQQRNMANAFLEVFGDMLLTQPIERNEVEMPSPSQLKRKFILKHKKLPDDHEEKIIVDSDEAGSECDISNAIKNGILFLEDSDHEWRPHFFMLTQDKMYYAEEYQTVDDEDDNEETSSQNIENIPPGELHFVEKWFHGNLPDGSGRKEAEKLLSQYSYLDGTFLVRKSETFVGDYTLSFWRQGRVHHCHIHSKQDMGQTKYYINSTITFDTLYNLITYYQSNQFRSEEFCMHLTEPVPHPNDHTEKEWFHPDITRSEAEEMLKCVNSDGAFLVRPSEKEANVFVISFCAENKIKHCQIKLEDGLYTVGTAQFESLVDLVNSYKRNALYKKIKLKLPVNKDVIRRIGGETDYCAISGQVTKYVDPKCYMSDHITAKALYDYRGQCATELSFRKHAIITNIVKENEGWWKGDYDGQLQLWFPATFVEEIHQENCENNSGEAMPLGSLQKGSIDIVNCTVDILPPISNRGREFVFRIVSPKQKIPIEIAADSQDEMMEWVQKITETAQSANDMIQQSEKMEKTLRIAKELSNLIVYCRSSPFNLERIRNYAEMSSFSETKIEKWISQQHCKSLLKYHKLQFSRVFPKGSRIDSSNYDPIKMWNSGSQIVALNYQTSDRAMQLNHARFLQNGRCGYVLRPKCMFEDTFDPYDRTQLSGVTPIILSIEILAARHLIKTNKGIVSPFIEVELVGAEYDYYRFRSSIKEDNGFNPVWKESFSWTIYNPELALIRFVVQYEDMFGDPKFLAQASYPVHCLRTGYRSIALKNEYSEELELAGLLVHANIRHTQNDLGMDDSIQQNKDQPYRTLVEAQSHNTFEGEDVVHCSHSHIEASTEGLDEFQDR